MVDGLTGTDPATTAMYVDGQATDGQLDALFVR